MSWHGGWGCEWECTPETCNEPGHPEHTEGLRLKALEAARTKGVMSKEFQQVSDEHFKAVSAQADRKGAQNESRCIRFNR